MAKDNRKILRGVVLPGVKEAFAEGKEDELEALLTQEQIERLKEKGAIEGDWKGKGTVRAPMPGSPIARGEAQPETKPAAPTHAQHAQHTQQPKRN